MGNTDLAIGKQALTHGLTLIRREFYDSKSNTCYYELINSVDRKDGIQHLRKDVSIQLKPSLTAITATTYITRSVRVLVFIVNT